MATASFHRSVSFTITAEDYASALRLHMRRHWATRIGPKLFAAAVLAACLLAVALTGFDSAWTSASIGGLIGLVVLLLLSYFFLLPRHAYKIHGQQKTMQYPVEASWNGEAYSASSTNVSGTTPWLDYYGWSADDKMILLMQSPVLFQMVPRRALSPEQAQDFIEHLERSGLRRI